MFTRTTIALASALTLAIASTVMAAPDTDPNGGHRESANGTFATQGINPVFHKDSATKCARNYPKSYDPSTMTFLGKDGQRHPCP
jgi:hypothetical protein